MHTVFSDGNVWPPVRVDEAWRQGLDAIAITDHIEYQPHKEDVPTNHNRSFDLAAGAARSRNILLTRSTEITRDTPPGHFNALFLKDVDPLDVEDLLVAIKRANEQGGFVFWNHHEWQGAEKGRWLDIHSTMFDNKWLHGMEVCNGDTYYPQAHRWCLEKNLTMIGNSDIHAPDLRRESAIDDHRTMTLLFVKDRTLDGVKEALQQGRTAVWYKDQIIGREDWVKPLFDASVSVAAPHVRGKNYLLLEIRNSSHVDVQLQRTGPVGPATLTLPADSTSLVKVDAAQPRESVDLKYQVTNFLVAPKTGLEVVFTVSPP